MINEHALVAVTVLTVKVLIREQYGETKEFLAGVFVSEDELNRAKQNIDCVIPERYRNCRYGIVQTEIKTDVIYKHVE